MLETEVKFFLLDPQGFRRRLQQSGALSDGGSFETNHRYDDANHRLLAGRCLLRLRSDRRHRLTYKRPHASGDRQFKIHDELEIEVSDFDTTHQILEALGFHLAQTYEKRRETFELNQVEICLDQLPFGHFAEIEGTPESIPAVAATLGLSWRHRILANYLQIFDTIRRSLNLPFVDITFDNFRSVQDDLTELIRQFEEDPSA